MAARRGGNRWIEQGDATGAAEALREFNVFHQCDVGETAEPVGKMSAPNEDGLIAIKRTEGTIMPAVERLEPAPAWMSFVKMSMKGATDDVRARRERSEGLHVRTSELRVGVVKKQPLAGRMARSEIELAPTIWPPCPKAEGASTSNRDAHGLGLLRRRDDDFADLGPPDNWAKSRKSIGAFPPNGHDHRNISHFGKDSGR